MGGVRGRREALDLTQQEAARRGGVSLATWRRLETADESVTFRRSTVEAVERVLKLSSGGLHALRAGEEVPEPPRRLGVQSKEAWHTALVSFDGNPLTPRQALKLTLSVAGMEDDGFIRWDDYLAGRTTVDELMLLSELPDWVLFMVNNHWLQRFRETFLGLGDQIDQGEVPYPGCMAEKVALWLMLQSAEEQSDDLNDTMLADDEELGAVLPHHGDVEDEWEDIADKLFDDDFDFRFIWLDNFTRLMFGKEPALETVIDIDAAEYHPFRWWERKTDASA